MKGEYTEKVNTIHNIIKHRDIVTDDGEVVSLHKRVIDEIAMDVLKLQEKEFRIKENFKEISEENRELIEEYGCFYFNFYKRYKDVEKQHLFRFMYICTFMNYDNYLANNRRYFTECDLKKLLKLSDREYGRTKKHLIESDLMVIDENDNIYINKDICKKGKIKKNKNIEVVRMFNDAIKDLYENSTPREHKKLALLIELLPYINYKYNILCENPHEEIAENIKPLSIKDVCRITGYDEKNSTKLKRDLLKIKVNEELAIGIWERGCGKTIYINPRICYKGKIKYLKEVGSDGLSVIDMFKVKGV